MSEEDDEEVIENTGEDVEVSTDLAADLSIGAQLNAQGVDFSSDMINFDSITWASSTDTCTATPELGQIQYMATHEALCIYDGESWKPLVSLEDIETMYAEFKQECLKNDNQWVRFLELELEDEDDVLPQSFKDEALIQMFRLKLQRAIGKIKFDKE